MPKEKKMNKKKSSNVVPLRKKLVLRVRPCTIYSMLWLSWPTSSGCVTLPRAFMGV